MGRAEAHNSLNHERIIRGLVEDGQFFAFFAIEKWRRIITAGN